MKKKILITVLISIVIALVLFLVNYIKEKKDAETKFLLDNENKYVLKYISYPTEGGFASSKHYCEIDLNNRYIDCRYDFEYWFPDRVSKLEFFMNSKKRKLVKRYTLTDDEAETLKKLFENFINDTELNDLESKAEPEFNYYILKTNNGQIIIKDSERKEVLKQILKNIDKDIQSFLLKR